MIQWWHRWAGYVAHTEFHLENLKKWDLLGELGTDERII
jgi:hypothetical protein